MPIWFLSVNLTVSSRLFISLRKCSRRLLSSVTVPATLRSKISTCPSSCRSALVLSRSNIRAITRNTTSDQTRNPAPLIMTLGMRPRLEFGTTRESPDGNKMVKMIARQWYVERLLSSRRALRITNTSLGDNTAMPDYEGPGLTKQNVHRVNRLSIDHQKMRCARVFVRLKFYAVRDPDNSNQLPRNVIIGGCRNDTSNTTSGHPGYLEVHR